MGQRWDAVVVGGGHNGLVAAALLAKAGSPRRGARGETSRRRCGDHRAAVGTGLQGDRAQLRDEPDAGRHRERARPGSPRLPRLPDGPLLPRAARRPRPRDGGGARGPVQRRGRVLEARCPRLERWDAWMDGIAAVLGPLLTEVPPKLGSKRPGDLLDQLKMAWRLRGLDVAKSADVTRLFTMSVGDLLREWFETDAVQAMMAVNGVIGTWAGPEEPGTAYVMLHHSIGDVGDGFVARPVGLPARRDGRGGRRHPTSGVSPIGVVVRTSVAGRAGPDPRRPGDRRRPRRRRGAGHRHGDLRRAPPDRLPAASRRGRAARRLRRPPCAAGAAGAAR